MGCGLNDLLWWIDECIQNYLQAINRTPNRDHWPAVPWSKWRRFDSGYWCWAWFPSDPSRSTQLNWLSVQLWNLCCISRALSSSPASSRRNPTLSHVVHSEVSDALARTPAHGLQPSRKTCRRWGYLFRRCAWGWSWSVSKDRYSAGIDRRFD